MRSFGFVRIAASAVLATTLMAGAAHAGQSVRFYSYGTGGGGPPHPPNLVEVSTFQLDHGGASPTHRDEDPTAISGFSWSGTGFISDTTNGDGAEPANGPSSHFSGNYLSVEGGDSETLTFPTFGPNADDKYITFYVGSLDSFNKVSFDLAGQTSPVVFTGNGVGGISLGAISGADNGNQSQADTNGVFTFLFSSAIKSVTFSSVDNSFEIENVFAAPTPEPGTWALMTFGVGLLGAALRLGKRRSGLVAA